MYVAKGLLKLVLDRRRVIMSRRWGVEEGFGVVCKEREGGTKEWNEGADERRRNGEGCEREWQWEEV
jgi:hypothetical protein